MAKSGDKRSLKRRRKATMIKKIQAKPCTLGGEQGWVVNYFLEGKRRRKYFHNIEDAEEWIKNFKDSYKYGDNYKFIFTPRQIEDIRSAYEKLPNGVSLCQAVEVWLKTAHQTTLMRDSFDHYKKHLKELNGGKLPRLRINSFFDNFKNWNDASSDEVLRWLLSQGAPKTIREKYAELKKFYDSALRRGHTSFSPLENIDKQNDLPRVERTAVGVWGIEEAALWFKFLEEFYPSRIPFFAITCFAGIRVKTAGLLSENDIDLKNRVITIPFSKSKTGDSWRLNNLPKNLWLWLEKYGVKTSPLYRVFFDNVRKKFQPIYEEKFQKKFKWKHNMSRHSFATYHLSLHNEPTKTAYLLCHRNPDTMYQHYLAGLVSKQEAAKYFDIKPTCKKPFLSS